MKFSSTLGAIVFSAVGALSIFAHANERTPAPEKNQKKQLLDAARWAGLVMGTACDFSLLRNDMNLSGSRYFEIRYRDKGQDQDSPDNVFPLYQLLCARKAANRDYVYLTKDSDGYRLLSFAEPTLDYDYSDETFSRLKALPKVVGFTATSHLANAEFTPEGASISMRVQPRNGLWSSGTWTFVEGAFVLHIYNIDPTSNRDASQTKQHDPAQTAYYQVYPNVLLKND